MADLRRKNSIDLLTGLSDDDLLPEELQEPPVDDESQKKAQEEYDRWLEEGLRNDKGYGQKISYEDHDPMEDGDSYTGSTMEAYAKQQAEAQAQITKLKAKDAERKARDDMVFHSLSAISILRHGTYIGDSDFFASYVKAVAWYAIFAGSFLGLFYAMGARGADLYVITGLGGVIGALVRYNGKEGYPLHLAVEHGAVEIGIFISTVFSWMLNLLTNVSVIGAIFIACPFACVSAYIREKVFFARSRKEAFFKSTYYLSILILVFVVALIEMLLSQ